MSASGRCLCGAVSFVAEDIERGIHICHCSMCRRWSGGPLFSTAAGSVAFEGAENITVFPSSNWAERAFCKRCGTNLYFRLKETSQYILNMGTIDDQSAFTVAGEIYIDDKPPGYDFAGEHARMTGEEFLASLKT